MIAFHVDDQHALTGGDPLLDQESGQQRRDSLAVPLVEDQISVCDKPVTVHGTGGYYWSLHVFTAMPSRSRGARL